MTPFESFFHSITGHRPHFYQGVLAQLPVADSLIRVPTGCGKTAAVICAWLWRTHIDRQRTPTRLVYCLPMRVLVEQTRDLAKVWALKSGTGARVYTLMGGEVDEDWEFDPEKPTILVGTQDMLLSRALNRGYAMSRYRWPAHFGLLNNACLWACDEVQLMGNGLGTTAQLQAFRRRWSTYGPAAATWWMSATADREWLKTVDYQDAMRIELLELGEADKDGPLGCVYRAAKPISRLDKLDRTNVEELHRPGTLTLAVRNTVVRAQELFNSLKTGAEGERAPKLILLHSRFRPPDRRRSVRRLLAADKVLRGQQAECDEQDVAWLDQVKETGLIAVSTQVVEAGVDLSAETLITEIAPWPSMVQRLGRCNRGGNQNGRAKVRWVPLPAKQAPPYEVEQLQDARTELEQLTDASIANLEQLGPFRGQEFTHVIREHDVHGLFSTEPDLAGGFTDISAYVREAERDTSVYVFWREEPTDDEPAPHADEICPVPVIELRDFLEAHKAHKAREWNGDTEKWEPRYANEVRPGMTLLLDRCDGGYSDDLGWTGNEEHQPTVGYRPDGVPDAESRDPWSVSDWYPLTSHLRDAEAEAVALVGGCLAGSPEERAVILASRWHDVGKNQPGWRDAVPKSGQPGAGPWAKFPRVSGASFRPGIRHEAASALYCFDRWCGGVEGWTALAVYLVAAHHGKVRTVLRSRLPDAADVFGVLDGDRLPPLDGWLEGEYALSLACRFFGAPGEWSDGEDAFLLASPSWVGTVAELLGPEAPGDPSPCDAVPMSEPRHLGPFRLAYLEALALAADVRASRRPGAGGKK